MPASLHLFLQGTFRIVRYGRVLLARVVSSRLYIWARPVLVEAGAELLMRGDAFAVGWTAKYVLFLPFWALLMFSSAYARLGHLANEFWLSLSLGDIPRLKYVAGRIVLVVGEVVIIRYGAYLLVRAVGLFVSFCLEDWLIVCACSGSL